MTVKFKCPHCDSTFEDKTLDQLKVDLLFIIEKVKVILDSMEKGN